MAIIRPPQLDDRNFEELRRELIRRIPVHSREWTDHNAADPGIALIELFAWLGENLLERLNGVPEKAQLEFLKLLNVPPRPATIARTLLKLAQKKLALAAGEPILLKSAATTPRPIVAAGKMEFQINDEINVFPVEAVSFVKERRILDGVEGKEEVKQLVGDHFNPEGTPAADKVTIDDENLEVYETLRLPAAESGVLPPATSLGRASDRSLWIALLASKDALDRHSVDELRGKLAGSILSVGVRMDDELCGVVDHFRCPDSGTDSPRFPVVWQIATGRFRTHANEKGRIDDALYDRLRVERDDTRALAVSGVVRLRIPGKPGGKPAFGDWTADQFEPSTPDILGLGNLPPRIDDDELAPRVLTWIRCFREDADDPPPRVRWVDINVVAARHAVTASRELLGFGNGRPGQIVRLSNAPVIPESLVVQVRISDEWTNWKRIEDLALSLPNDPHFALEAASGEIRFGDGVFGRMPLPGEAIRCLSYQYGGGAAGNVAAEAIKTFKRGDKETSKLEVANPFAASGGRDSETIEEARKRIPKALRHRERAVAREDFQDIVLATPGVHVGRVHVLPRHKPHERVDGVPGVVTLVAVPAFDALHPDTPTPDREMLRRVCEHLESRRLVTTELYVTPPEYIDVWVSVAIAVEGGYGIETVERWVELAVRQYLAPLPPYGPDGKGWPFDRDVLPADVEAAVLRVEGVRLVHEVLVRGRVKGPNAVVGIARPFVPMKPWQLVHLVSVQVVESVTPEPIDTTIDRADPRFPTGPTDDGTPEIVIQVPVQREEC